MEQGPGTCRGMGCAGGCSLPALSGHCRQEQPLPRPSPREGEGGETSENAFLWKNLSVTELLSLHGRGLAFPRRFLSIPPKPEKKTAFQALPKHPEPLLILLLRNAPSPPGKGGLQTLKTCSQAPLSTLAVPQGSCRGWGQVPNARGCGGTPAPG